MHQSNKDQIPGTDTYTCYTDICSSSRYMICLYCHATPQVALTSFPALLGRTQSYLSTKERSRPGTWVWQWSAGTRTVGVNHTTCAVISSDTFVVYVFTCGLKNSLRYIVTGPGYLDDIIHGTLYSVDEQN